jgi:hypothetical protein
MMQAAEAMVLTAANGIEYASATYRSSDVEGVLAEVAFDKKACYE